MKKIVCTLAALALLAMVGCAKGTPEDAAKEIVEKQIATKHKGFILDTSDLEYRVIEDGKDFARVVVTGEIEVKGEIGLVKEGGRWVIAAKPAPAQMKQAPAAEKALQPQAQEAGSTETPKGH
ncbi:MAG: hypothetical protein K9K88_17615 [Desulfobacterales bacterium]|nr:hypothetical protein [Desulfobacterales bacterium]